MAGSRDNRQAGDQGTSKGHDDPYKTLCDDVKTFIRSFYLHIKHKDITEIENDYVYKFPKLTDQYFKTTRWPSVEIIAPVVNQDPLFMMLYNELFYRHIYAHVTSFPELEEAHQSYLNYCALFDALLKPNQPVQLEIPNQWLWDIVDEFIYQFQKFSASRNKSKRKPEDDAFLRLNPTTWSIHSVLKVLFELVDKSNINLQLNYYATQRDPDEVAGPFGKCPLYKMLGFFSLVGLCRVHCHLGDYFTALKMFEHVQLSRQELYHEVPTCHITTGYYVGFAYMMMRRFQDAIRTFTNTLCYITRVGGFVSERQDLRDYVVKQSDQMTSLLAICITLNPMPIDQSVEQHLKDKFAESLNRLQKTNKDEFTMCFDMGCPRFVNPDADAAERTDYVLDAQRHQGSVFRTELEQHWIDLPRLRSYLKLYTTLPVAKLNQFLRENVRNRVNDSTDDDDDSEQSDSGDGSSEKAAEKRRLKQELAVHSLLMRFKHLLKNVTSTGETCNSLEGTLQIHCDTDFYVDGAMVHIADMKVDRRFSEFFMLQLEKLREVNNQLDEVEKKLNTVRIRNY